MKRPAYLNVLGLLSCWRGPKTRCPFKHHTVCQMSRTSDVLWWSGYLLNLGLTGGMVWLRSNGLCATWGQELSFGPFRVPVKNCKCLLDERLQKLIYRYLALQFQNFSKPAKNLLSMHKRLLSLWKRWQSTQGQSVYVTGIKRGAKPKEAFVSMARRWRSLQNWVRYLEDSEVRNLSRHLTWPFRDRQK